MNSCAGNVSSEISIGVFYCIVKFENSTSQNIFFKVVQIYYDFRYFLSVKMNNFLALWLSFSNLSAYTNILDTLTAHFLVVSSWIIEKFSFFLFLHLHISEEIVNTKYNFDLYCLVFSKQLSFTTISTRPITSTSIDLTERNNLFQYQMIDRQTLHNGTGQSSTQLLNSFKRAGNQTHHLLASSLLHKLLDHFH